MSRPLGPEDHPDWGKPVRHEPEEEPQFPPGFPEEMKAMAEAASKARCALSHKIQRWTLPLYGVFLGIVFLPMTYELSPWLTTGAATILAGVAYICGIQIRRYGELVHYLPIYFSVLGGDDD